MPKSSFQDARTVYINYEAEHDINLQDIENSITLLM